MNDLNRFHLVGGVIGRASKLGSMAEYAKQAIRDRLTDYKQYVDKYGQDMRDRSD